MKAMLFAAAVIIAVIGAFAVIIYRDPHRAETRDALAVLHESSSAPGNLDLKSVDWNKFSRIYSADRAILLTDSPIVKGTLLKQEYLFRQTEYKLAQLKRIGGEMALEELEQKRLEYADATEKLQSFWDSRIPGNEGSDPSFPN